MAVVALAGFLKRQVPVVRSAGVTMRWTSGAGPAFQLDDAVAPLGAAGLVHDATLGVRR